jgi:hypothetical protein
MPRLTEAGLGGGVGLGRGPARPKPKDDPEPQGAGRVVLSPPLRRAVADLHAARVFAEHLAPHFPRASFEQLADLLTAERVPPVRGSGRWNGQRVYHLLQRARRAAKTSGQH